MSLSKRTEQPGASTSSKYRALRHAQRPLNTNSTTIFEKFKIITIIYSFSSLIQLSILCIQSLCLQLLDKLRMAKGYMYILECSNGAFYTGSTKNLTRRLQQHQNGEGANFTQKHLPVRLIYFEVFSRIDLAFYREKQVQGWSRRKKIALISGRLNELNRLSKNYSQYGK